MAHYVYPAAANTAQPAQAYPAVQTAFVAATPQAAAYATAPRAGQAYDAYQTQHTAPQYAYARTQVAVTVSFISGPSCSKLSTWLVNKTLKFQTLISQICQYFLLKKCEKLLHCKSFSHFFQQKISVYLVIKS